MCKGGGSTSTINPQILQMLQSNYHSAQNVANRPYQHYTGQLTAGLTPSQLEAGSLLQSAPGMGQGALNAGVNAAQSGTQYQAPLIGPPSANAAMAQPGLLSGVTQTMSNVYAPDFGSAALAGRAAGATYAPFAATTAGPEFVGPAAQATPGSAGPAAQANAASINANALPLLSAPNGLAQLSGYLNPYMRDVTDATLAALNLQNQQQLTNNAQAASADKAFGGDRQAVADALTNQAFQQTAASTLANLNSQGFNTAAGLLQNNEQMGLQAGTTNLNAALNAANANAANQQQVSLTNAAAANNLAQFNAGNQQQANLANAAARNAIAQFNAGNSQAANLFNAGASNTAAEANAQALLNAGQFNASAQNALNQYNTGNRQAMTLANLGYGNQAAAANAAAANAANQYNAGALNTGAELNAGNQQAVNLANQNAANQIGLANLNAILSAAQSNQSAANAAQGLNLQGAGLLGTLGGAQNANYLNGVNALNTWGAQQQQTAQNALNAAYQQYLNQFNYPVSMQQLLNSALSGGLGAGTANPAAAGQSTGGLLGGLGSLGSAAAALIPLL